MKRTRIILSLSFFETIAVLVVSLSAYLALAYASQPPLDLHSFRQTQTALTAYWFTQEGFKWAYETPVAGAPWAIPFEFPVYQLIVAWFSQMLDVSLDSAGRVISYAFLFLCIFPARSVTKRLELPDSVFAFFVAILFSMPLYLYWGRSFMIETTALFFSIATIKYWVDCFFGNRSLIVLLLFLLCASLAMLQKSTTAIPVLIVLFVVSIASEVRRSIENNMSILGGRMFATAFLFAIPIAIGACWVLFTDQQKLLNPFGQQLTSANLGKWNWGSFSQRVSSDLWGKVIWERILKPNMAGVFGVLLLLSPFFAPVRSKFKVVAAVVLVLGLLPLFLFTNLHIVHDYYQTGSVIFFAYGVAVALGVVVLPKLGRVAAMAAILSILASNYFSFGTDYLTKMEIVFTKAYRDFAVGNLLRRELPERTQFVAFGNDWSSTFAYISRRKSFTVPEWFGGYDRVVLHPEEFVEKDLLGGVVSCAVPREKPFDIIGWADRRSWKTGETHGCLIATPEKQLAAAVWEPSSCLGSIDSAEVGSRYGRPIILLAGWTTTAGEKPEIPDDVFLKISNGGSEPLYLQALKVPRPVVNNDMGISDDADVGFSRVLSADMKPGDYEVEILQVLAGRYRSCGIKKLLHVD